MPSRPRVRQAARRDANHDEIVGAFLEVGASVLDLHQTAGALDLLVGVAGIDQRVEVKDGAKPLSRRRLTEAETDTFLRWRGRKPVVVRTADEARWLVSRLRLEARCYVQIRRSTR